MSRHNLVYCYKKKFSLDSLTSLIQTIKVKKFYLSLSTIWARLHFSQIGLFYAQSIEPTICIATLSMFHNLASPLYELAIASY